jgi:hypothetical protein
MTIQAAKAAAMKAMIIVILDAPRRAFGDGVDTGE